MSHGWLGEGGFSLSHRSVQSGRDGSLPDDGGPDPGAARVGRERVEWEGVFLEEGGLALAGKGGRQPR